MAGTTLIGRLLKNKALPGKKEILTSAGNLAKDFIKNPKKAFKAGLERDKLANTAMKAFTGKTRGQATKQLTSLVAKGFYKGGGKDLAVNTGGLAGSLVGSAGGKLGSLAGDWGGAAVARKALDDTEAVARASKMVKSNHFKNLPANKKVELLRRKTVKEARKNAPSFKKELKQDTIGWAIGNSSADSLKAAGSRVPLQGGIVAIGTVPSAFKGARVAVKTKNAKLGALSAKRDLAKKLNLKKAVKKAWGREDVMRSSINKELQKLPSLPQNVNFSGHYCKNSQFYRSSVKETTIKPIIIKNKSSRMLTPKNT